MNFDGLTITIGAPGSGKSTWADKNLSPMTLRLERDRFRECLFGSRRAYHESPVERSVRSKVVTDAMMTAMTRWPEERWAVTDTGLRFEAVAPFIDYAGLCRAPIRLVVFERSPGYLTTCNRIRPAEHRIPEDILLEMIEVFNDPEAWWRNTDYATVRG